MDGVEDRWRSLLGLAAVGKLAAGLEHPLANLMQAVVGHLQLADGSDSRSAESLQTSLVAARQMRELVRRLAGLSVAMSAAGPAFTAAHGELLIPLLRAVLRRGIRLDLSGEERLGDVALDAATLTWLLVGLVETAQRWLPHGGGIELALGPEIGTDAKSIPFAMRTSGSGNGLGDDADLVSLRALVIRYGGSLELEALPGVGTAVRLLLPSHRAPPEPTARGRVLHVESREEVVSEVTALLSGLGFASTRARGALEALELLRMRGEAYDVVLADESTLDLPGRVFAREALSLDPGVPVLIASGFAAAEDPEFGPALSFVSKPYAPRALDAALRAAIGGGRARSGR